MRAVTLLGLVGDDGLEPPTYRVEDMATSSEVGPMRLHTSQRWFGLALDVGTSCELGPGSGGFG